MERKGFSILEMFIIVVILGVIASVALPRFSAASTEARTSTLVNDLQMVRNQIKLFKSQHCGRLPGKGQTTWEDAMLGKTTDEGKVFTEDLQLQGYESFGPYLRRVPRNPFNNLNSVRIDGAPAGQGTHGWRFDSVTGSFQSDDLIAGHEIL